MNNIKITNLPENIVPTLSGVTIVVENEITTQVTLSDIKDLVLSGFTGGGGDFIPLSGTESGNPVTGPIEFGTGGQNISRGSFDNGTSGDNGISLNCSIGYELNWQGGKVTVKNGSTTVPLELDSAIKITDGTEGVGKVLTSDEYGVGSWQNVSGATWGSIIGTLSGQTDLQDALNLKANLESPTFTGTVELPSGQVVNGVTLTTTGGTTNFLRADGTYAAPSGGPITIANSSSLFSTGLNAGEGATGATNSNFIGESAGSGATNAEASNFLGYQAGYQATDANTSNFLGQNAGNQATNAYSSNFFGESAGQNATNAYSSNFLGSNAGKEATNAVNSIFIGQQAGMNDTVDNTTNGLSSILIGSFTNTSGYSNSILLGSGTNGSPIYNTKSNQFMLANSITDVRWRGIDYTLPSSQASAGQVLSNNGSGVLSWQNPRPYKVYTALLTQSGSGSDIYITTGPLTIGITYWIDDITGGVDFTNVGAPNNNLGTYFVATGTTPNSWGTGGQLGYNTGAPVVTVLENTIGNIWFTYDFVGQYSINSNGLFTTGKTWLTQVIVLGVGGPAYRGSINLDNPNRVGIQTESDVDTAANDLLYTTPIEIRVYN